MEVTRSIYRADAYTLWVPVLRPEHLREENLTRVRALNDIARARGQTLAQMALAWVLRDPRVTSTVIGASSVEQLDDSLENALQAAGQQRREQRHGRSQYQQGYTAIRQVHEQPERYQDGYEIEHVDGSVRRGTGSPEKQSLGGSGRVQAVSGYRASLG